MANFIIYPVRYLRFNKIKPLLHRVNNKQIQCSHVLKEEIEEEGQVPSHVRTKTYTVLKGRSK
jgi:uncharacterized protein (UPF0147 family)